MFQLLWGPGHLYLRHNQPFCKMALVGKPCFEGDLLQ